MTKKQTPPPFRFRATDTIGAAGAEDDREFLAECFVDTGALGILAAKTDNRLIAIGRTGAGKSALLSALAEARPDEVIRISPEQLALTYVANSNILNFFSSLGVNLDPFFKLLWRHVFAVEILGRRFAAQTDPATPKLLDRILQRFLGPSKHDRDMRQAINYLDEWAATAFWQDTEYRVKEITSQVEAKLNAELRATLGPKAATVGGSVKAADAFTQTERGELISRGQNVISQAQVQDLSKILQLIDSVLDDEQHGYYIVIDNLDENWVEERLRYKLIMALIQTARDFNAVRHAKVVIAIRRDLIDRVFRLARDSGFQEEKYQSLYLPLVWTKDQILEVLDKRINVLVRRHYSGEWVSHRDLLPTHFRGRQISDYIYSVAPRPRDVIAFFNSCISAASDEVRLTTSQLKLAEGDYSRGRLRALADEWSSDYPTLIEFARLFNRRPSSFKAKTIADAEVIDLCLEVASERPNALGLLSGAMQVVDDGMSPHSFKLVLIRAFYHTGLVGLKLARHETESWSDELGRSVSFAEIDDQTSVVVHPAYRRALGVHDEHDSKS
jgi:hypothetical protein